MELISEGISLSGTIKEIIEGNRRPVLISVCGGTSTGKTSWVSRQIKEIIGDEPCLMVELDNFQKGKVSKYHYKSIYGHDTPEYFELEECIQAIQKLKDGEEADIPIYDFKLGKQTGNRKVIAKPVIIFEGLFAAYGKLGSLADLIIIKLLNYLIIKLKNNGKRSSKKSR